MRVCVKCKAGDRAEIDPESLCKCGANEAGHENHDPECPRLMHNVTHYFVRVSRDELTIDKKLTPYYAQQGWALKRDGERFYRWLMLCRACIRAQDDALGRQKDYLKACRAAKGIQDMTYSQMLASQGS